MTRHPVVKKFAEIMGWAPPRRDDVTAGPSDVRSQGPVTRTFPLPDGKSMKVIRRDTFERAIGRGRTG